MKFYFAELRTFNTKKIGEHVQNQNFPNTFQRIPNEKVRKEANETEPKLSGQSSLSLHSSDKLPSFPRSRETLTGSL